MQTNVHPGLRPTMQPIVLQPFEGTPKPRRPGAAILAIVIQTGLIYLLAMGLGVVPKPVSLPESVMITVPQDLSDPPPTPLVQEVKPEMLETQMPVVPQPDIVVDVPVEAPIEAVTTTTPMEVAPTVSEAVSEQVKVLQNAEPPYPNVSILRQEEGTVLVRITVGVNGKVSAARVERSSGFAALDDAALKAIRTWRFSAAKRGGQAVETSVVVPVIFELRNRK
jgi:periplasmic protein TonB